MLGSILGGIGGSIVSGIFGNKSQKKQLSAAQHQFDQQMDHSIQRRVSDAKKAGVHPLYALGASSGASPTISASGQHAYGSGIGDAIAQAGLSYDQAQAKARSAPGRAAAAARDQELHEARLGNIKSDTAANLALAQKRDSEIARMAQGVNSHRDATTNTDKGVSTPFGVMELGPNVTQQRVEDEYGGIVGEGYGVTRFARDRYRQYEKNIPKYNKRFYESKKRYRQYDQVAP